MEELTRVAFLGIAGVMLAVYFKSSKAEYGSYIGMALGILIFSFVLRQVEAVIFQFDKITGYLGSAAGYLSTLMKVVGITYICEFSAGICKDAGYQSIAGQIEVLGKLSVLFAGIPILFAVIEQIQSFL